MKELFNFLRKIYLLSSILCAFYATVGVLSYWFFATSGYTNLATDSTIIYFSAVQYFFWFKIFQNLETLAQAESGMGFRSSGVERVGRLLLILFFIGLVEHIFILYFATSSKVNWDTVQWPAFDKDVPTIIFGILAMFFKFWHYWNPYILPSFQGVGLLLLAKIVYSLNRLT